MKKGFLILPLITMMMACQPTPVPDNNRLSEVERWQLGWRVIANSLEEDFGTAAHQFDSLLALVDTVDLRVLIVGLEVLEELGQEQKRDSILAEQSDWIWELLCEKGLYHAQQPDRVKCVTSAKEEPRNTALRRELIEMKVRDQMVRGNILENLITHFQVDTVGMSSANGVDVDTQNRERLKSIIAAHGFPTAAMVGEEAMSSVFILIQHADADPEWQKSQLNNIKAAVKSGDLDGQDYAYLYDRIQVNAGKPQRYGTQFSTVDPATKTIKLAEVEDPENLNQRRMEVGMMPIETYRALVLSRFQ
jgi:hypothetical protein